LLLLFTSTLLISISMEYADWCYDNDGSIGISCSNHDIKTYTIWRWSLSLSLSLSLLLLLLLLLMGKECLMHHSRLAQLISIKKGEHFLIGKLLRKIKRNRFISRLMDQKLIRIINVYVIHWDFWLVISWNFNCKGVLPEFCIDIDVFFLRIFYWSFVCSFL